MYKTVHLQLACIQVNLHQASSDICHRTLLLSIFQSPRAVANTMTLVEMEIRQEMRTGCDAVTQAVQSSAAEITGAADDDDDTNVVSSQTVLYRKPGAPTVTLFEIAISLQ